MQDVPKAYGVHFVPKKYLLDSKGIIKQVDPSTEQIMKLLEARYGSKNSND